MRVEVVDISAFRAGTEQQRRRIAGQVDAACRSLGFLVIRGSGVSDDLVERMRAAARRFFDQPEADKLAVRSVPRGPGYQPMQATSLGRTRGDQAPPDLKEGYRMFPVDPPSAQSWRSPEAAEWFMPNLWPESDPTFEPTAVEYSRAMQELAATLMEIFAVALGLSDDYFVDKIEEHISHFSLLHYPGGQRPDVPDQIRAGAHTDYGSLTILNKEPGARGLQVQLPDGSWLDVTAERGDFIVNLGDLLADWTNRRWVSTVHRVINPVNIDSPSSRTISMAFFHQPNFDAVIEAIPTCVTPERPALFAPVSSGDHLRRKMGLQEGAPVM